MNFYVSKVTATGIGKTPAIVSLTNGLNIICGVSDSGKTCILKCIQFAMGGDKKPFDKKKTGYDAVSIDICTSQGNLHLSRSIGRNIVNVVSEVNAIDGGDYDITYKKDGNKRPVINELMLKLIGINELPMIISNQVFERKRLTWKTLSGLFWLKEQEIENPKSVVLPSVPTQHPYFFSSLIYLFTGNSFPDAEEQEKDETAVAKKGAVRKFVTARISHMSEQRATLEEQLAAFEGIDVDDEIQKLLDNLSEAEEAINAATNESKDLLSTLMNFREQQAESNVIHSQFQSLKTQYVSDIKRLSFIVESEVHSHSLENNTTCPFCNGEIKAQNKESYIVAAKAELARIVAQLQGLSESENDILDKIKATNNKISSIEQRRSEIENLINKELTPHATALQEGIVKYRSYIKLENEMDVLQSISKDLIYELQKHDDEETDTPKFKPKAHFPEGFNTTIDEIAYDILHQCKYEGLNTAHFNMGTFDLDINGTDKETSHGKGYWAFINTVMGLTFKKYLEAHSKFKPNLFVVDTPLLGLDQGVDDSAPISMRTALFQYFIDNQGSGQTIIVENTKDLPELNYVENGANVIEFTKDKYQSNYNSRYGFLYDVFN